MIPTTSSFYRRGTGCPEWLKGLRSHGRGFFQHYLGWGWWGIIVEGTVCSLPSWLSLIIPRCRPMKLCLSFHLAPGQRSTLFDVPPALGTGRMALLQQGSLLQPLNAWELLRKPKPQDCLWPSWATKSSGCDVTAFLVTLEQLSRCLQRPTWPAGQKPLAEAQRGKIGPHV